MAKRKAYVLVECAPGRAVDVARAMQGKPGVLAADVVSGPTDVIVTIEAADSETIARMVLVEVAGVEGVNRTMTCGVICAD